MLMISKVDKLNIINNYFQTNIILRILKLERTFRTYIRKIYIYNNIVSIVKQFIFSSTLNLNCVDLISNMISYILLVL